VEESVEREIGALRARPLDAGLAEHRVELALVTTAPPRPAEPFELPERAQRLRARVDWDAHLPERAGSTTWELQQVVKRGLDVMLAAAGLVLLMPLFVVVAVLVKLSSRGPVLYEWRALGYRARPFVAYKFRTMVVGAEAKKTEYAALNEMSGPVFKLRRDPRVTPLGRWLRKFSIDELPQLWSVLKGDMSLVGPRPPLPDEFSQYEEWQCGKLAVKPGITCFWQVSGRSEISDFRTWARLDLQYIREWNLWLDFRLLLRTIPAVLSGRGAY
jgi:lipopolysaccharide/colanic/teichoic acid biosynthesis glycosyltransferase